MSNLQFSKATLVYQAGIANVFVVDHHRMTTEGRNARRLLMSDFRTAEAFARGLGCAGVQVTSMHCNRAGDVAEQRWDPNVGDAPFSHAMQPVYYNTPVPHN